MFYKDEDEFEFFSVSPLSEHNDIIADFDHQLEDLTNEYLKGHKFTTPKKPQPVFCSSAVVITRERPQAPKFDKRTKSRLTQLLKENEKENRKMFIKKLEFEAILNK